MSDQRILITGCNGFCGRHLVTQLKEAPFNVVYGVDLSPLSTVAADEYLQCDLRDSYSVKEAVERSCPDRVYHLAGLTRAASDEDFFCVNVDGFKNLCRSLRKPRKRSSVRIVAVGSAAEIGSVAASQSPVPDDVACSPETAYGRSKWEATQFAVSEPLDSPLQIIVARPFNLVGPGMNTSLSLGSFAQQIADVVHGESNAVLCGPLYARRDFLDVRDAVEAYVRLCEGGRPAQVYNVCRGYSFGIGDLLGTLIQLSGGSVPVRSDPGQHFAGVPDIFGDNTKLKRDTGWEPRISIEESLRDLLNSAMAERSKMK